MEEIVIRHCRRGHAITRTTGIVMAKGGYACRVCVRLGARRRHAAVGKQRMRQDNRPLTRAQYARHDLGAIVRHEYDLYGRDVVDAYQVALFLQSVHQEGLSAALREVLR